MEEKVLTKDEKEKIIKHITPQCLSQYYYNILPHHHGCLFYDGEHLCIIDSPWRKKDFPIIPVMHESELELMKEESNQVARGLPALIMAYFLSKTNYGNDSWNDPDPAFMQYILNKNYVGLYLADWKDALTKDGANEIINNIQPIRNIEKIMHRLYYHTSEYIGHYYKKQIAAVRRCNTDIEKSRIVQALLKGQEKTVVLLPNIPELNPYNFERDLNNIKPLYACIYSVTHFEYEFTRRIQKDMNGQLYGFAAFVFSRAILNNFTRRSYMDDVYPKDVINFMSVNDINKLIDKGQSHFINEDFPVVELIKLNLNLNKNKEELFQRYLDLITPLWKQEIAINPIFPSEIGTDETNLFSVLLYIEQYLLEYSTQSEIWNTIDKYQQSILQGYTRQFIQYLRGKYNADVNIAATIIRSNKFPIDRYLPDVLSCYVVNPSTDSPMDITKPLFEYISTEDTLIAQQIEKELSQVVFKNAPAKVSDILLEYEQFMSYPKKLPDDIYNKLQTHFGKLGFTKEAFSRAWRRRKK